MDRTEAAIRQLLAALPAPGYDLGILTNAGMYRLESVPAPRILRMLPYLKHQNAQGAHIYIRPTGESPYTLLDDLTAAGVAGLTVEGYRPAAVIETSPGNFQAWLRHVQPLSKELGTLAAKTLAEQFGADRSAADWRRFGRAPGFTNRKPNHRNAQGLYPFCRLVSHCGQHFPLARPFHLRLTNLHQKAERERAAARLSFASRPTRLPELISLARFRTSRRYDGRPAAADMAFCIAACSRGWSEPDIAAAISRDYLSRDTNPSAEPLTSAALSTKPYVGWHKQHMQARAFCAAGRTLGGFSLHPHRPAPAPACRLRARGQVPPCGLSLDKGRNDDKRGSRTRDVTTSKSSPNQGGKTGQAP